MSNNISEAQRYSVSEALERAGQAPVRQVSDQVKEEFAAIFYKELLKQTFKPPKFGFAESERSFSNMFYSDLLVEKLALELARKNNFSVERYFPNQIGILKGNE